ncbi:MAG: D-alanyl-D-alanine carboxypeptidase [Oscillospiraceae bacterium]|jgi:D-alanyl-D-alanine carboxypeptidase/D-alanyl-D-alanine carboxypeptidase (penicillin-binding protein 5/6)|nr:D-alanyl-D-alanine carboxypeptidase [Oscillospiraceae bacterium]
MFKKIISIIMVVFSVFIFSAKAVETEDLGEDTSAKPVSSLPNKMGISAKASVVINSDTGLVHYAYHEHEKLPMASTTKILTSLIILENADLDEVITATDAMVRVEGTSMGLLPGDKVDFRALAYGMLLESGNDAANTAAIAFAGSIDKFAQLMNQRAAQIGMKDSHFTNPSGLNNDAHYSTAYDMALLGAEAIKNKEFAKICSTPSTNEISFGNPPVKRYLRNHNKLLTSQKYDGANGIKTGFTKKAGRCLVSSVSKDGVNLVAVTLSAPDDWNDHKKLYDYALSQYKKLAVEVDTSSLKLPVAGGLSPEISLTSKTEEAQLNLPHGWQNSLESKPRLAKFVYAPISEGQQLGYMDFLYKGKLVGSVPLYAAEASPSKACGWLTDLIISGQY